MDFPKLLAGTRTLADIFEVVKRAVERDVGYARGGLMLALADLGNHPHGFIGAFYPIATNVIVMNKVPLTRVKETSPDLWRPYAFHVLLHEYLHSVGYVDERQCRQKVYDLSLALFGEQHVVTGIATDVSRFFPPPVHPGVPARPAAVGIEPLDGFDGGNAGYVAWRSGSGANARWGRRGTFPEQGPGDGPSFLQVSNSTCTEQRISTGMVSRLLAACPGGRPAFSRSTTGW